jgi:predicted dehydrogenase
MLDGKESAVATPLRIALVGTGRIAQTHLEAIAVTPQVRLTALVEPRREAAAPVAAQTGATWFPHHQAGELLDLVDAAIICAPPNLHAELARHFLDHGKHVLCEKPLAPGPTEAETMQRAAQGSGCTLMMASKFRYTADVVAARELVRSGQLGQILAYENCFSGRVDMSERWNAQRAVAGGGVIMDNGTHSVDIARYLLGPITRVHALAARPAQRLEVEDSARIQFETAGGCFGLIDLTWSYNKFTDTYIAIHGSQGVTQIGWKGSRVRFEGQADWQLLGSGYDKIAALGGQLAEFAEVAAGRAAPRITLEDALASVEVIAAVYRSLAQSSWTPIGESQR